MSQLAKKLRIVEGTQVLLLAGTKDALTALSDLPKGAKVSTSGRGPFGVVIAFAMERRDVEGLFRQARAAIAEDGILWMAYRKKSAKTRTDLSRDEGWEPLAERAWVPVTQIAFDDTWSALRFKHDPALQTERARRAKTAAAEKATVSLRRGGEKAPTRTQRREAATVSLRGPGLVPGEAEPTGPLPPGPPPSDEGDEDA